MNQQDPQWNYPDDFYNENLSTPQNDDEYTVIGMPNNASHFSLQQFSIINLNLNNYQEATLIAINSGEEVSEIEESTEDSISNFNSEENFETDSFDDEEKDLVTFEFLKFLESASHSIYSILNHILKKIKSFFKLLKEFLEK